MKDLEQENRELKDRVAYLEDTLKMYEYQFKQYNDDFENSKYDNILENILNSLDNKKSSNQFSDKNNIFNMMLEDVFPEIETTTIKPVDYSNILSRYDAIINKIINIFCDKQGIEFEMWRGDTLAFRDAYFFTISEITHDLNTNQPKGLILQWARERNKSHRSQEISYVAYTQGKRFFNL